MKKPRAQQPPQLHTSSLAQGLCQDPRGSATHRSWVTQNQLQSRQSKVAGLQNVYLLVSAGLRRDPKVNTANICPSQSQGRLSHHHQSAQGHRLSPVIPPSEVFLSCLGAASQCMCFAATFQSCGCILFVTTTEASRQQRKARCPGRTIHLHSPQVLFL